MVAFNHWLIVVQSGLGDLHCVERVAEILQLQVERRSRKDVRIDGSARGYPFEARLMRLDDFDVIAISGYTKGLQVSDYADRIVALFDQFPVEGVVCGNDELGGVADDVFALSGSVYLPTHRTFGLEAVYLRVSRVGGGSSYLET